MSLLLDVLARLLGVSVSTVYMFRCRSALDEHSAEERSL